MPDNKIRPSSESATTPQTPTGEDIKDLVTPGENAAIEAEAQTEVAPPGGEMPGADEEGATPSEANPDPDEAPEEERSPT